MDKKEREALVAKCRASGMTAKAWCAANGIKYRYYVDCASRMNKERKSQQPTVQQWADVTMIKEEGPANEIKLSCGKWTIHLESGFSPTLLADVLKVVNSVC